MSFEEYIKNYYRIWLEYDAKIELALSKLTEMPLPRNKGRLKRERKRKKNFYD